VFSSRIRTGFGAAAAAAGLLSGIFAAALPAVAHPVVAHSAVVADDGTATGDCGSIELGTASTDAATLKSAASCLQHAYSACQTAQLHATWTDGTGSVDRVFMVSPGESNSCFVAEMVTKGDASGSQSSDTYRCASVTSDGTSLTIKGCGADGDVKIPISS